MKETSEKFIFDVIAIRRRRRSNLDFLLNCENGAKPSHRGFVTEFIPPLAGLFAKTLEFDFSEISKIYCPLVFDFSGLVIK